MNISLGVHHGNRTTASRKKTPTSTTPTRTTPTRTTPTWATPNRATLTRTTPTRFFFQVKISGEAPIESSDRVSGRRPPDLTLFST